jgi:hypothetical protein
MDLPLAGFSFLFDDQALDSPSAGCPQVDRLKYALLLSNKIGFSSSNNNVLPIPWRNT